jgi:negative regulator of genetic competence, sporulation and motility
MRFNVTVEDTGGVDGAVVDAVDMDAAFEAAMDELGRPLSGRDEGLVTIRVQPV